MVTREQLKESIVEAVSSKQGCKDMELFGVPEITTFLKDIVEFSNIGIDSIIDELVKGGKLVEIEYTLPQMPYRVKSFLLPAGTHIMIWHENSKEIAATRVTRKMGPLALDHPLVQDGDTCTGCKRMFEAGQYVALVTIGPGDDKEARYQARSGKAYNAVAVPVHWSCVTGEE